jgi:hypothetical protein
MGLRRRRKFRVAQAKNLMRRAVREIIDRSPRNLEPLWKHFCGRCAYCGRQLIERARDWHLDHADPGRGNHLGNAVLSCAICNGDEKRDRGWLEFLQTKASGDLLAEREALIRLWFNQHSRPVDEASDDERAKQAELEAIVEQFGNACAELNALVRARRAPGR